jgi:hypothetical protein
VTSGVDARRFRHEIQSPSLIPGARFEIVEGASHIGASASDPRVLKITTDFALEGRSAASAQ